VGFYIDSIPSLERVPIKDLSMRKGYVFPLPTSKSTHVGYLQYMHVTQLHQISTPYIDVLSYQQHMIHLISPL
jgi:hypothetical protein